MGRRFPGGEITDEQHSWSMSMWEINQGDLAGNGQARPVLSSCFLPGSGQLLEGFKQCRQYISRVIVKIGRLINRLLQ